MKKHGKKIVKVILVICLLVLIVDVGFLMYTKNKVDKNKTFFTSNNGYVEYNNGYYAVGSDNLNKNSVERASLTRYDSNYKMVNKKVLKTKYNSTYFNIARDDKYLLAVGSYEKTKEDNEENLRTALFVKYDSLGNIVFRKELQILGNSKFTKVLVEDDGYIVIGQSIYPNNVLGNEKTGGGIIVKYSKDGKIIWQKNYGGNKSGVYNDIVRVGDSYYLTGKDASRYGLLVKYSLDGELEKAVSTYGILKTDTIGFSSIVNKGKYLYVCGAKKLDEEDEYNHDIDGLIVKYDLDLNKKEDVTFKDDKKGLERFNKIIVDGNDFVVIGHEAIEDKEKSDDDELAYNYSGIIAKYNSKLKLKNSNIYKNDIDNYFTDISIGSNGKYLVGGYSKYKENRYVDFFVSYDKELSR